MMKVARSVVLLFVVAGGWSMAACAPPTPKVGAMSVPQRMWGEPFAPLHDQDRSIHRTA